MRELHEIIAARVGQRLKALRGERTQAEYAGQLGVNLAQYNRYETGKRLAPDKVLVMAAEEAGMTPEALVFGSGGPGSGGEAAPESVRAVAELAALLAPEDQEDLYLFLQAKTEDLARRRKHELKKARNALGVLRKAQ